MDKRLNILALEPYDGGSHRAFLDTLVRRSRHRFQVMTLPARKWKWRMRGAAIWFADRLRQEDVGPIDLIFTNDMLSVADLRALLPASLRNAPVLCYFHENQLTYPLSPGDRRDFQFGFTNVTSCLASDGVWFNSDAHRAAFLAAVGDLLRKMPDFVPAGVVERIASRSRVVWPLIDVPPEVVSRERSSRNRPPVILWCHRWEYDKAPESFFASLFKLDAMGIDFRLALLGETFRKAPEVFGEAWSRLGRRIVYRGFVEDRGEYWRRLQSCDVVVSTAYQETFGLAVVEAILAGCQPLLPDRLSYPELIPPSERAGCLYAANECLTERLGSLLRTDFDRGVVERIRGHLVPRCAVSQCIELFDRGLGAVVSPGVAFPNTSRNNVR